jgi:hypothetical protein
MPEQILSKEDMEFAVRFGGATLSAIEQWAFEWYLSQHPEASGKFPYMRPETHMPMYADLLVFGVQLPPWLVGLLVEDDARKKGDTKTAEMAKGVKEFGEGGVLYSGPMLVHHTAVRSARLMKGTANPAFQVSQQPPARQAPPLNAVVVKL